MTTNNDQVNNESQAFKSAVRKLMQVPTHELREKIAEEESKKKADRAPESNPDESDRPADQT